MRSPGAPPTGAISAMPPGDMFDDLTGKFAPIRQHIAAEQIDFDALVAAAVLAERPQTRVFVQLTPCAHFACHRSRQSLGARC